MTSWRRAGGGVTAALLLAGCAASTHDTAAVGPLLHVAWHSENAFSATNDTVTTCRFIAVLSGSGSQLRVEFSDASQGAGFTVISASVALAASPTTLGIRPGTSHTLTFGGPKVISTPVTSDGSVVVTDPVSLPIKPGTAVAVTVNATQGDAAYGSNGSAPAGCTNGTPQAAATAPARTFTKKAHIHWVSGILLNGHPRTSLLVLGDTFLGSSYRWSYGPYRWTDMLLPTGVSIADASVSDAAISRAGLYGSVNALTRLKALLDEPGLTTLLIETGTNDLLRGSTPTQVLAALSTAVHNAQAKSLKVIVATLPPRGGVPGWTSTQEQARQQTNTAIRRHWSPSSGVQILDLDALLGNPNNHTALNPMYDLGDHLHVNQAGHRQIASTVSRLLKLRDARSGD